MKTPESKRASALCRLCSSAGPLVGLKLQEGFVMSIVHRALGAGPKIGRARSIWVESRPAQNTARPSTTCGAGDGVQYVQTVGTTPESLLAAGSAVSGWRPGRTAPERTLPKTGPRGSQSEQG
ncbi:hypothetical protein CSOJ01_14169 [Colletotrichum sojae]|uniref:Uncharacterized protein n=1 Tax=Colletotrichum sojae TaxID=2175907 RepID=A0A8H6MK57_9PEZI|nr:hypothetical protein CSOJ01_14169 [Colletotrichum sojae]